MLNANVKITYKDGSTLEGKVVETSPRATQLWVENASGEHHVKVLAEVESIEVIDSETSLENVSSEVISKIDMTNEQILVQLVQTEEFTTNATAKEILQNAIQFVKNK